MDWALQVHSSFTELWWWHFEPVFEDLHWLSMDLKYFVPLCSKGLSCTQPLCFLEETKSESLFFKEASFFIISDLIA